MLNTYRNEMGVTLNSNSYILKGSFDALARIEDLVGSPILAYVEKISSTTTLPANMSAKHIKGIIIIASTKDVDVDQLEEDILVEGLARSAVLVSNFLAASLWGGDAFEKQASKEDNKKKES